MATQLLPGVLVGLVLAGLFAATMSTADSQLLACSAALTQDLFPGMANNYRLVKLATLVMTGVVLMIALRGGTVFQLVVLSWSALASGLGPLLILRVFNRPLTPRVALLMMGTGIGMVLFWRYQLGLSGAIYDVLPGMAAGFAVYVLCFILGFASAPEDESNRAEAIDVGG
jgi:sodium/proline symporter